jgi:hypothetical protein
MTKEKVVSSEERDRLSLARQSARRDQFELQEKLGPLLVSPDHHVFRQAKNEIQRARRRSLHALRQLMDHQSNHRCWQLVEWDSAPIDQSARQMTNCNP